MQTLIEVSLTTNLEMNTFSRVVQCTFDFLLTLPKTITQDHETKPYSTKQE